MANTRVTYTDEEYRAAARRLHSEPEISVPPFGSLQRCAGGAYVELLFWVPDAAADDMRAERAFNARADHPTR